MSKLPRNPSRRWSAPRKKPGWRARCYRSGGKLYAEVNVIRRDGSQWVTLGPVWEVCRMVRHWVLAEWPADRREAQQRRSDG